jgi:hypothetical protein
VPPIRTLRGWAIAVLQDAGVIRECDDHGWMRDHAGPHARERPFAIARAPGVSAAELRKRLEPLVRKTQAFAKRVAHKGIWVEPKLLAKIEYRAKSAAGKVRHPFFRGLREDL